MGYKTMGAGTLFFTIFIVGFSFVGGVVPSAAYAAELDYGGSYLADVDYGGNFFGNWGGDCCSAGTESIDYGGSYLSDIDYGGSYGFDSFGNSYLSDSDYGNGYGVNNYGNSYLSDIDYGGSYLSDVDYGGSYLSDIDYGGSYLSDIDYGGSYLSDIDYGGSYLADTDYGREYWTVDEYGYYQYQPMNVGSSYAQSYSMPKYSMSQPKYQTAKSTVYYIDTTKKQYNVQTINPFIPQPTCQIYQALASGMNQGAYLSWTSAGATSASISNIGLVPTTGNRTVYPTVTTTYVMTVYGQGGTGTCSTVVQGYTPPTPIPPAPVIPSCEIHYALSSGSNYNYGYNWYGSNYNYGYNYGNQGALLSWSSANASSAHITTIGSASVNGSQYVYPNVTTTYVMTVYGINGGSNTCSTTVPAQYIPLVVPPAPLPQNLYCTMTATQNSVYGGGAVLNWTSYGAYSATLSDGIGNVALNGSLTVRPEAPRTYTLTVRDYQGRVNTCEARVGAVTMPYVSLTSIPYTGFDGGPVAQMIYWLSLVLFSGAAGYLIVSYRGGIGNIFADVLGRRSAYAGAYVTPDAVILEEKIIARSQPARVEMHEDIRKETVADTPRAKAMSTDRMTLEEGSGTPRIVISRG